LEQPLSSYSRRVDVVTLLVMLSFAVTGRLAQVVTPHAPRLPGDPTCTSVEGFASGFLPT